MKRKRFSDEQIIKILQAHEASVPLADFAREHGFAQGTIYMWKAKYGGLAVADAKRGERTLVSRLCIRSVCRSPAVPHTERSG